MGGRLLKRWVALPLKDEQAINDRLEVVKYFTEKEGFVDDITSAFKIIGDLERLISKVALHVFRQEKLHLKYSFEL